MHTDGTLPRPPGSDVEGGVGAKPESYSTGSSNGGMKLKGDCLKLWSFICRTCALVFSLLAFILMVCVSGFYIFSSYSYVLAIAIITTVYSAVQVGIKGHELRTKMDVYSPKIAIWIDFCGDQVLAYLLFSSASSGVTASILLTNSYTYGINSLLPASSTMAILAFLALATAALFSAYRLFANL